jgi:superoxide dismutase, Fe-Mn family
MAYQIEALSCDPARIKGMSERLIVSHYENNYCGAVKRLNQIEEQLAELDYAKAASFLINGLKREQLIAMNSMILHELFSSTGSGSKANLVRVCATRWREISDRSSAGGRSSWRWARRSAAAPDGCCCRGRPATASS